MLAKQKTKHDLNRIDGQTQSYLMHHYLQSELLLLSQFLFL